MVLGNPGLGDTLTARQILKMGELHSYLSKTPEQREADRKEREFKQWSKQIQPGWVPSASDLQGHKIKK